MTETYTFTDICIRLKDKSVLTINNGGTIVIADGMVHAIADEVSPCDYSNYIYQLSDVVSIRFTRKEAEDDGLV